MMSLLKIRRISHLMFTFVLLATSGLMIGCGHDDDDPPRPAPTYSIGGTVSQLSGVGLVLKNNDGDNLSITENGSFNFSKKLNDGAAYAVTISQQPSGENCTVSNASGKVTSANLTNISVVCDADPTGYYDKGTLSVSSGSIEETVGMQAMISGKRIMMVSIAYHLLYDGMMTIDGDSFTANVKIYNMGKNPINAVMTGTITEGSQIQDGVLTYSGGPGGVGNGSFSLTLADSNNQFADVARIDNDVDNNPAWGYGIYGEATLSQFTVTLPNTVNESDGTSGGDFISCAHNLGTSTISPIANTALYDFKTDLIYCAILTNANTDVTGSYSGFAASKTIADKTLVVAFSNGSFAIIGEFK